jgi:nicotinamide-nucleotide amidase
MMERLIARAEAVGALLKARNETIAVAESSAGGLAAAALLSVPGASAYFVGAGVVYTRKAFIAFTQASEQLLQNEKPGSEAAALSRARIFREHLGTTWGLSETGTAGPSGSRYGYPPGRSCVAVCGPLDAARTVNTGSNERVANMYAFADAALALLEESLRNAR